MSWAALTRLGPDSASHTEVLGVGERIGAAWDGDLYLHGDGDPTLTSADLAGLAASLRASGIRRVTGRIRGDESAFDKRRGAAGWKSVFRRGRDAAALGARRRPRARLAGALAPAPRGTRPPGSARRAGGDRGRRPRAREGAGRRRARSPSDRSASLSGDRPDDEPRQRQLHGRDAPQAPRHGRRPGGHERTRRHGSSSRRWRRRGSPSPASGSSTARGCPRSTG